MSKSWKSLFIKSDESEESEPQSSTSSSDNFSFPVSNTPSSNADAPTVMPDSKFVQSDVVKDVIQVYEKGLDSINMPGYDFYEYYRTIISAGINSGEQVYIMAYRMAQTLDNTVTAAKLLRDAEFYISKINEVHSQYSSQGQQKMSTIQNDKKNDKAKLTSDIDAANRRMMDLRNELQSLEMQIKTKQEALVKVDGTYLPQEQAVTEKLNANDYAHKESISKLNRVKDGINQFLKTLN